MNRKKLEALTEAIVKASGYLDPESAIYQSRNPGGLKAYSPQHPRDAFGNRVFNSMLDGWQALLYDAELKITGKSKAKLLPQSNLMDLAVSYNLLPGTAQVWAKYLRRALIDESITHKTTLSYFLG